MLRRALLLLAFTSIAACTLLIDTDDLPGTAAAAPDAASSRDADPTKESGSSAGDAIAAATDAAVDVDAGAPEPTIGDAIIVDTFARQSDAGLGFAELGGRYLTNNPWTIANGEARTVTNAGTTSWAFTDQTTVAGCEMTARFSYGKDVDGSGAYFSFVGRRVTPNDNYQAKVRVQDDHTIKLYVSKLAQSGDVDFDQLELPIEAPPNVPFRIRVQIFGMNPTTLRARLWPAAANEPGDWQVKGVDGSPNLQVATGKAMFSVYVSSTATASPYAFAFDDFTVRPMTP